MPNSRGNKKRRKVVKVPVVPVSNPVVIQEQHLTGIKRKLTSAPDPRAMKKPKRKQEYQSSKSMVMGDNRNKYVTTKEHQNKRSIDAINSTMVKYRPTFSSLSQPSNKKEILQRDIQQLLRNWHPPLKMANKDDDGRFKRQQSAMESTIQLGLTSNKHNKITTTDCRDKINKNTKNTIINENETVTNEENHKMATKISPSIYDLKTQILTPHNTDSSIEMSKHDTETSAPEHMGTDVVVDNYKDNLLTTVSHFTHSQEVINIQQKSTDLAENFAHTPTKCTTTLNSNQEAYINNSNMHKVSSKTYTMDLDGQTNIDLKNENEVFKTNETSDELIVLDSPKTPINQTLLTPPTPPTLKIQINNGTIIFLPENSESLSRTSIPCTKLISPCNDTHVVSHHETIGSMEDNHVTVMTPEQVINTQLPSNNVLENVDSSTHNIMNTNGSTSCQKPSLEISLQNKDFINTVESTPNSNLKNEESPCCLESTLKNSFPPTYSGENLTISTNNMNQNGKEATSYPTTIFNTDVTQNKLIQNLNICTNNSTEMLASNLVQIVKDTITQKCMEENSSINNNIQIEGSTSNPEQIPKIQVTNNYLIENLNSNIDNIHANHEGSSIPQIPKTKVTETNLVESLDDERAGSNPELINLSQFPEKPSIASENDICTEQQALSIADRDLVETIADRDLVETIADRDLVETNSLYVEAPVHGQNNLTENLNGSTKNDNLNCKELVSYPEAILKSKYSQNNILENVNETSNNNITGVKPVVCIEPIIETQSMVNNLLGTFNDCVIQHEINTKAEAYISCSESISKFQPIHNNMVESTNKNVNNSKIRSVGGAVLLQGSHLEEENCNEIIMNKKDDLATYPQPIGITLETLLQQNNLKCYSNEKVSQIKKQQNEETILSLHNYNSNLEANLNENTIQNKSNLKNKESSSPTDSQKDQIKLSTKYPNSQDKECNAKNQQHHKENSPSLAAEAPTIKSIRATQGPSVFTCNSKEYAPYTVYSLGNSSIADEDFDISNSQLACIEDELKQDFIHGSVNGNNQSTKSLASSSTTSCSEAFMPRMPQINWTQQMQANRQKLRSVIQEISRLNAMLTKVRREVWPIKK